MEASAPTGIIPLDAPISEEEAERTRAAWQALPDAEKRAVVVAPAAPQRLPLAPDDVILLRCSRDMSEVEAKKVKTYMEGVFPGHRALVLTGGLTLDIVSPEDADAALRTVASGRPPIPPKDPEARG